jgi:ferrochelatase
VPDANYDAILFVSFGGPEGPADVIPFLENVVRGRNIPRERLLAVAEHYYHFGGVSPINQQNRELIRCVTDELARRGITTPIYWGNRNWHPLLAETLPKMKAEGIQRAIAFVTSAHSSYSGCRQYRQNIADACTHAGDRAPQVDKIRVFYNHPDFIAAYADRVRDAIEQLPLELRSTCRLYFTAHSIPLSMARNCDYEKQLQESCRLVAEDAGISSDRWQLVYQSRSGRPEDPWLEPDVLDALRAASSAGVPAVVLVPLGFLTDHLEVLYDLDEEAGQLANELRLPLVRAKTVGTHPRFITMICKLIEERLFDDRPREAIGQFPANWDACAEDCCPAPMRRSV